MPTLKQFLFSLLLLSALALSGLSTYIIYHHSGETAEDLGKPDAFMEEVTATIINKEGSPSIQIVATKMTHYVTNDTTEIIKPLLTLYRKSPKPWHLTADHARSLQGTDEILLWENVVIQHPGDINNEQTTLLTPTLTVYPEKQIALTPDPVTIHQPNSEIFAVGMNADLVTGAVKLLSQARGEYSVQN